VDEQVSIAPDGRCEMRVQGEIKPVMTVVLGVLCIIAGVLCRRKVIVKFSHHYLKDILAFFVRFVLQSFHGVV
jgi:hypothetical protein